MNTNKNLPKMQFNFSQYEAENSLDDILDNGDIGKLAERLGRSETLISQMCNPHDERESDFYKAAKFVASEIDINQNRGLSVLRLFNELVMRHIISDETDINKAMERFLTELSEFEKARMCGKPKEIQISELQDVHSKVGELLEAYQKDEIRKDLGFDKFNFAEQIA